MIVSAALAAAALAQPVADQTLVLDPSGPGAMQRIRVENSTITTKQFQAEIFEVSVGQDGALELTPADDALLITPTQIFVPAESGESIAIEYAGPRLENEGRDYIVEFTDSGDVRAEPLLTVAVSVPALQIETPAGALNEPYQR